MLDLRPYVAVAWLAPGGPPRLSPALEPGQRRRRRRLDSVRRNSAVQSGKPTPGGLSVSGQALRFVESELPWEGVELLTAGAGSVRLEFARP